MYQLFEKIGITLSQRQREQFEDFTKLLLEWNQKMNLTAITDPDEIILKHYLDSALLFQTKVIRQGMKTIDVGCGAGFPSVPAKIIRPDLRFTLLDSLNKRLHFLNCAIEKLGLKEIETLHMRAEDAGQDEQYRQQYELCVARAVAPLNILMDRMESVNWKSQNMLCRYSPWRYTKRSSWSFLRRIKGECCLFFKKRERLL